MIKVLSNAIERHHPLRYTPSLLYLIGCRNWVQKLLDQKERDKQKVHNQANQIQTQIMIERGNLLFALKEERTILSKSKHILFVKKL